LRNSESYDANPGEKMGFDKRVIDNLRRTCEQLHGAGKLLSRERQQGAAIVGARFLR
jgi:hypothetical protein